MLYSENLDLAFVHIAKTGGVSFRAFLQETFPDMRDLPELEGPHHTVTELFETLQKRGRDPLKTRIVTLIRHPFAQVVSQYTYWKSDLISELEGNLPHVIDARRMTFPEFVDAWVIEDQYATMLLIDNKLPENVNIIRLEHLQGDTERVFNRELGLNIEVCIPHLNRSSEMPFADVYTDEAKKIVRCVYKWYFQTDWNGTINPRWPLQTNSSSLTMDKIDIVTGEPLVR